MEPDRDEAIALHRFGVIAEATNEHPRGPGRTPGATGLQDLLNWTLYGGAIACAATSMYRFAKMEISLALSRTRWS